ncbi:methyltransferase domain-containing protein [Anabaena sphaerica FACHB-251]|uniref:Methyltransferase domain-containing protein n=1 Tax=Anabaena sphaerica FACHB-251 TaxID=2692883 RepID=A0A926WMP9_9NOST|nr:methyltransferase domain-containing protein [Anabaena sphaerica]MBD2296594.1 methyltransferase domain-containing protein [Anabaena sphaerica FACHB-251]
MDNYKQQIIEFFNSRTAYDQEKGSQHPLEAIFLLESIPLHQGQKILDIATGTGLVAIPTALKVGSEGYVIGVDMSPGMLRQAREKVAAVGLKNIEFIEEDAEYIHFNDGSFDVIFCCSSIVYFIDIPTSLQKWHRFLKPEGFVAFTCPTETAYMASVYTTICANFFGVELPHILATLGTPEKCHKLLTQAGLRDIEIKIEKSGRYSNFSNTKLSNKLLNLIFKGHPLLAEISQGQLDQLQVEYKSELEKLVTDQGVWEETTTFFVRARK